MPVGSKMMFDFSDLDALTSQLYLRILPTYEVKGRIGIITH
jgi:hypothetical protein